MTTKIKTVLYKSCQRCRGDLVLEQQDNSIEYSCIQCGGRTPLRALASPGEARLAAA